MTDDETIAFFEQQAPLDLYLLMIELVQARAEAATRRINRSVPKDQQRKSRVNRINYRAREIERLLTEFNAMCDEAESLTPNPNVERPRNRLPTHEVELCRKKPPNSTWHKKSQQ